MTAVKVKHIRETYQSPQPRSLPQRSGGLCIHLSQCGVKPGQGRIAQERVGNILSVASRPLIGREQHRHRRGRIRKRERFASSERLFQFYQREAGINGEKRPARIFSLHGSIRPAALPDAVAKNCEQRPRFLAIGSVNHRLRAGQYHQFSGLLHIPLQQDEKLGGFTFHVSAFIHLLRQQRQHFIIRGLLADASHAQERAQRARNRGLH